MVSRRIIQMVRQMPEGPGKVAALAEVERLQEAGKAVGRVRKLIAEQSKAERESG